jgi:hypothetical protein
MNNNDENVRKPLFEFGRQSGGGRNKRGGRPRFPAPTRSVLLFIISLAACGFLTWWLWVRFRVRFYFMFIPLIGLGGPIFGRLRRRTGDEETPGGEAGGDARRLLEDRKKENNDHEGGLR